ncbi:MAG TPA: type VI secretion system tube protein TssD [Rhodothermales bacterium]|nr:type VI secretion system tube protein TssD [Rhodothermales bacterium]
MPLESALFYDDAVGITGNNSKRGREKSSVVIEYDHEVYSPVDEQRGIYTGARVHKAVELMKEIDTASPGLYQACCEGKNLPQVSIKWYEIDGTSADEVEYFETVLNNVKVVSVQQILPDTKETQNERKRHLEKVRFMYEEITWKHLEGYEYTDSWKAV